jgi:hypothetical protein
MPKATVSLLAVFGTLQVCIAVNGQGRKAVKSYYNSRAEAALAESFARRLAQRLDANFENQL